MKITERVVMIRRYIVNAEKELKYQYILRSKVKRHNYETWIEHFKEHSGIPNRIAYQVRKEYISVR